LDGPSSGVDEVRAGLASLEFSIFQLYNDDNHGFRGEWRPRPGLLDLVVYNKQSTTAANHFIIHYAIASAMRKKGVFVQSQIADPVHLRIGIRKCLRLCFKAQYL
jgi:hypothetical protein